MSDWVVEKRPTKYAWATNGWAWREWARYAWAGTMVRSKLDYYDLWLNRDRYIEKYYPAEEIQRRNEALKTND